jgi:hypothetical protein
MSSETMRAVKAKACRCSEHTVLDVETRFRQKSLRRRAATGKRMKTILGIQPKNLR